MLDKFTLVHTEDPSLRAEFKAPTRKHFEAYWNDVARDGDGVVPFAAKVNLCVACREEPDPATFRDLIDEEWSGLPEEASAVLFLMSGFVPIGDAVGPSRFEAVDARALLGRFDHLPDERREAAEERAAFHLAALEKLGAPLDMVRSWLACKNPHISRLVVACPWGGYYVARAPRISDRIASQNVHRAPSSEEESGAYAALLRLLYDCALWSAPMSPAGIVERHPGAGARLGLMVRDLGGGYRSEEKKS